MELNPTTPKERDLLAQIERRGLTAMRVGPHRAVRVYGDGVDVRAVTLGTLRREDLEPYFGGRCNGR